MSIKREGYKRITMAWNQVEIKEQEFALDQFTVFSKNTQEFNIVRPKRKTFGLIYLRNLSCGCYLKTMNKKGDGIGKRTNEI